MDDVETPALLWDGRLCRGGRLPRSLTLGSLGAGRSFAAPRTRAQSVGLRRPDGGAPTRPVPERIANYRELPAHVADAAAERPDGPTGGSVARLHERGYLFAGRAVQYFRM